MICGSDYPHVRSISLNAPKILERHFSALTAVNRAKLVGAAAQSEPMGRIAMGWLIAFVFGLWLAAGPALSQTAEPLRLPFPSLKSISEKTGGNLGLEFGVSGETRRRGRLRTRFVGTLGTTSRRRLHAAFFGLFELRLT